MIYVFQTKPQVKALKLRRWSKIKLFNKVNIKAKPNQKVKSQSQSILKKDKLKYSNF